MEAPGEFQQHDRVLSALAWVVVCMLVAFAGSAVYRQITTAPERPALLPAPSRRAAAAALPLALTTNTQQPGPPAPAPTRASGAAGPARQKDVSTLEIGTFQTARKALRFAVELGLQGHTFTPVRDLKTGRYQLHYGRFAAWSDAIPVLQKIRARRPSVDVRLLSVSGKPVSRRTKPGRRTRAAARAAPSW